MYPDQPASNRHRSLLLVLASLAAWSAIILYIGWKSGARHDYVAYLEQWELLLNGGDPWATSNAYGPLHTLVGFLLLQGKLAPKIFMIGLLLAANVALVVELIRQRGLSKKLVVLYVLVIPGNAVFFFNVAAYGLNDTLVAALLTMAVLLRYRQGLLSSAALVGLAALTKYYPILLLPFFALDGRKIQWRAIFVGVATFGIGIAAARAFWGESILRAIAFGADRDPKLLSILAALQSTFGDAATVNWLVHYNSILVVSGVGTALLFTYLARLNWLEGLCLGYFVMLVLYKVGHTQFYLPWLFVVASLPLVAKSSSDRMGEKLLPVVLFLSLYQVGYWISGGYAAGWGMWIRMYGGAVAFPISVASLVACVLLLWQSKPALDKLVQK
jgi:hypothetical protein